MSAVEVLRSFVSERLTAAAQEIFGVVERTLMDYEREIERQRLLLDIVLKPQMKLHRIDEPEGREEEVLNEQQIFSPVQEEPQPPQMKEEQEEFFINVEGEPLEPKQEEDANNAYKSDPNWEVSPLMTNNAQNEEHLPGSAVTTKQEEDADNSDPAWGLSPLITNEAQREVEEDPPNSAVTSQPESKHEGYSCGFCAKKFSFKSLMLKHMTTHTGERPFLCNYCGKNYSSRSILKVHMRSHTGERPFSCSTCGKTFSQSSNLNTHMKIHTGEKRFSCSTCGKRFPEAYRLTNHMRTHTGEKPFSCSVCGKRFPYTSHLRVHMRSHTGERFTRKGSLNAHNRIHTQVRSRSLQHMREEV